jgi:hypothetical protein
MEGKMAWERDEVLDYVFFRFRCRNSEDEIEALSQKQKEQLAKQIFSELHNRIPKLMKEHYNNLSNFIIDRHGMVDQFRLNEEVEKETFFKDLSSADTEDIISLLDEELSFWRFTKEYKVTVDKLAVEKDIEDYLHNKEFDEREEKVIEKAIELAGEWPGVIDEIYDIYKVDEKTLINHLFSTINLITEHIKLKSLRQKKG